MSFKDQLLKGELDIDISLCKMVLLLIEANKLWNTLMLISENFWDHGLLLVLI